MDLSHPALQAVAGEDEDDEQQKGKAGAALPLQNLGLPEGGVEDMCGLSFLHVSGGRGGINHNREGWGADLSTAR